MSNTPKENPVVLIAKENSGQKDNVVTLSTGYRARIVPVAASLLDEVSSRVEDPEIPDLWNPDKERNEPNPLDPRYQKALAKAERARGVAALDAMVMFGVELVDPIPDVSTWLAKLKRLERMGYMDLSAYDLNDPIDMEFLFKRFIVVANDDMTLITRASSMTGEEVKKAEDQFQGNA